MKEFVATLHIYNGQKHKVVVQVDRQENFVNITANVSGEKTTFTMKDCCLQYINKLKNGDYCSDEFYASCTIYDGNENHQLEITANKYSCDGLWMTWEESWQDGWVRKSNIFILSIDDPEATEFLQYIIDGFNK